MKRIPEILAVAVAVALVGCGEEIESDPATSSSSPRVVLAATADAAPETSAFRTHLYSELDADVYSRLDPDESVDRALVEELHAELGDRVRAGQLLATLEDEEAQLAVRAARAEAEEASANFARMEELRAKEVVTQADYDAALATKRLADARLERAELELARTQIRAPFGGVVSRRYVRVGEILEYGDPLFRVTALSPLRARILVPEGRGTAFEPGAPVELSGREGQTATAQIILVSPTIDPGSGTREVIVELAEPDGFRPGASVTARLTAGSPEAAR